MDIFDDYKYMYYACGVMMLVGGIFLLIMNYYNYKWLAQEEKQRRQLEEEKGAMEELKEMGSSAENETDETLA